MLRSVLVSGVVWWWCGVALGQLVPTRSRALDGEYNSVNTDGSFDFGYANRDRGSSYHVARGSAGARAVGGRFGSRDPATGVLKETVYTAGPRGFRAKGPDVHRKMDLDQRPRGPVGNRDDPYFDPSEDPSYDFQFKTRSYSKNEVADSRGDVKGHYSFVDDVGERHDVSYVAGRDTGFHVSSPHPDTPAALRPLYYRAPLVRGETRPRGRTSVQRGLDGSYRFISAGPDQRRSESSDAHGNVRGSYSFLDDKGVQRTVHYIAGPGIGYRIVKNSKDPYIPAYFPTIPSAYDPDFIDGPAGGGATYPTNDADDVFKGPDGTSASGHVKPPPFSSGDKKPGAAGRPGQGSEEEEAGGGYGAGGSEAPRPILGSTPETRPSRPGRPSRPVRPASKPYAPPTRLRPSPSPAPAGLDSNEAGVESGSDKGRGYGTDKDGYRPDKDGYGPAKDGYKPNKDGYRPDKNRESVGPQYGVGFDVEHSNPGATVIRNIGEEYLAVPPGVAVRAHVQSIDLYPFGSKLLSPGEAIEKVKS